MISITKKFYFEMAHALDGYNGACRNIHGHSYELHVTIKASSHLDDYLSPPGFLIDFKLLKQLVKLTVIEKFDHKLVLSKTFLNRYPGIISQKNLEILEFEPSVENLLIYVQNSISKALPSIVKLRALKLYETKDSYAEWTADTN
jgi:6-pyruvoyltetrahydropterin/6-carboxytetrahydropterin synthase